MIDETPKTVASAVVRIWKEPKKQLLEVIEAKTEREGRPISEVEVVSKAVNQYCKREKRKLGIA